MGTEKIILFLTREEVVLCGGGNVKLAGSDIQKSFELLLGNKIIYPWNSEFKNNEAIGNQEQERENFFPSYVNFDGEEIYSCKSIGTIPSNVGIGLPRTSELISIFEPNSKTPVCIMDDQVVNSTRTGAVTMLAVKKLANPDTEEVGLIGAGNNMRAQLWGLVYALPKLKRARVYSRGESKYIFTEEMGAKTGLEIIPVQKPSDAVEGCDLIVTCLPFRKNPLVKDEWIKEQGVTIINIGSYDVEMSVLKRMDRIVTDIWEHGKKKNIQPHALAVNKKIISEESIEELAPILTGNKPGRQSMSENIFFAPSGLDFEDAMVAWRVYKEAKKRNIGTKLTLWKIPEWYEASHLHKENLMNSLQEAPPRKLAVIYNECREIGKFEKIPDEKFQFETENVSIFTVPYIADRAKITNILDRLNIFMKTLLKVEKYALEFKESLIYKRLINSINIDLIDLIEKSPGGNGYSSQRHHRRIDGYMDFNNENYVITDINHRELSGASYYDISQRVAVHLLNSMGFYYEPVILIYEILDWLTGEYCYKNPGKFPHNIALVMDNDKEYKWPELIHMAKLCENLASHKYGKTFVIKPCFPGELKLSDGKILIDELEIDMIWKNTITEYGKENYNDYAVICSNPDKYPVVDSTKAFITDTREIFSLLWDDESCGNIGCSPEDRDIIRQIIPQTVNLKYNPEMIADIIVEKDLWVSKPLDLGYSDGNDVPGTSCNPEEWLELIMKRSKEDGYIFQKPIIAPEAEIVHINKDGNLINYNVEFDLCFHYINGNFTPTALARATTKEEGGDSSDMKPIILPVVLTSMTPA